MRRPTIVMLLVLFSIPLSAKEVFLSIGGSVNNFRTDARILNPSNKTITVQAWLLPVGNQNNGGVAPVSISIPPRQMKTLDDVVATLFNASGIGAIRLSSTDDFVATQRIYATTAAGTLGQFVPGLETSEAKAKGALIQLKVTPSFRTNIGVVNPNASAANVTWYLYDKANAVVATSAPMRLEPYGVVAPTSLVSGFFFDTTGQDLSDAWVSYVADQPIFAYASIVDNATTDPTFIPAATDSGAPGAQPSPPRTYQVSAHQFAYDVSPAFDITKGDVVKLEITATDTTHGFTLIAPDGSVVIQAMDIPAGNAPIEKTFTATQAGRYSYFCTHVCGSGHGGMSGSFTVTAP